MVDRDRDSGQRAAGVHPGRLRLRPAFLLFGRARAVLSIVSRVVLLFTIVWALTGPIDRVPGIVGAAGLGAAGSGDSTARAAPSFQENGFAPAEGPIGSYVASRGGTRTFGPAVSNEFMLLGARTQIFRDYALKVEPSGAVSTMNLFAMGAIPFRSVGGRMVPDIDPVLIASAPAPGSADYAARIQAFVQANAPDQWENLPVGFYQAFRGTVRYEDALPNGGDRALLNGFNHEIWGVPVSRPVRDAQSPDVILLRWERGVMAWNQASGTVTALPLGETFKQVLTGEGLGPERTAAADGSQFFRQLNTGEPNGVDRPDDLPNTVLTTAFSQGGPSLNAAQMAYPYGQTATPTPYGYNQGMATATPTPYGYNQGYQAQQNPCIQGTATPTPTPFGYAGNGFVTNTPTPGGIPGVVTPTPTPCVSTGFGTPTPGLNSGGINSGAINPNPANALPPPPGSGPGAVAPGGQSAPSTGADLCYQDEQITFAPETPRVNNELLVAVSSSRPHPYGRLAGTEKTTFVRERQGQLGYVWEWTVVLSYPGKHSYMFYVDSTVPCKSIDLTVSQALATPTLKPTKTATPWGQSNNNNSNNSNSNNNNSNNSNSNTNDNNNNGTTFAVRINPSLYITNPATDAFSCRDFQSQYNAQQVLRWDPSDPNRLDSEDGVEDGVACSTADYGIYNNDDDTNPVTRTTATSTPSTGTSTPTPATGPTATATRALTLPNDYVTRGDAFGCVDFSSQKDAQAVLRYGVQNGFGDPNKLDTHNARTGATPDGVACTTGAEAPEWSQWFFFPDPKDETPVPRVDLTPGAPATKTPLPR